jgi:hypothetical protein
VHWVTKIGYNAGINSPLLDSTPLLVLKGWVYVVHVGWCIFFTNQAGDMLVLIKILLLHLLIGLLSTKHSRCINNLINWLLLLERTPLEIGDSILVAFGKIQAQLNKQTYHQH